MRLPANGTVASALLRTLLFTGATLGAVLTSLSHGSTLDTLFFGALTVALCAIMAADIVGRL